MKNVLLLAFAIGLFATAVTPVMAGNYGQYGQYNGSTPSVSIILDKMVAKPGQNKANLADYEYVDNLSASDARYHAAEFVPFRVSVKNNSNTDLKNVTVKEFIPAYIAPVEGPGSYDSNNNLITINAGDFKVNEEKVYYFKMKVVGANDLPSDKGLFCVTNRAQAYNDKVSDDDTAQLCIERTVTGITPNKNIIPKAGPEFGLGLVAAQMAALSLGIFLKKRS